MRQQKVDQSDIWRARAAHAARVGADVEDVQVMTDLAAVYRGMEHTAIREKRKEPAGRCGAKTRKGLPCIAKAKANGRCRNHGGCSTGPKTPEGRQRIAEAQRARWARWRSQPIGGAASLS